MMLLSKFKGAGLASLAVMLVATGAGVLAQQPLDPRAEPDRMAQLERKIDRLLEALGGCHAITVPDGTIAPPAGPAVTAGPPGLSPAPSLGRGRGLAAPPATVAPARIRPPDLGHDRLDDLERRLADVEKRLDAMEARLKLAIPTTDRPSTK